MRTIKVTGTVRLKLRPDTTELTMTLTDLAPDYASAIERSAEDTEALTTVLEALGFARAEVKTTAFSVTAEHEGYEEQGVWKQRLAGYRFLHVLCVRFAMDDARLGAVLTALAACPVNAELRISHTLRDPDAAKDALIAMAFADAAAKAEALARAAGVTLGAIEQIAYAADAGDFSVTTAERLASPRCAKAQFDAALSPDDVEAADTVTVVWSVA